MSEHELWNELGNLHYLSGSYAQAIHAYNKAIQLDRSYGKPYSNLALIYAKQAKYEAAIDLYKRSLDLLKSDDEKAITWNRLGNVYRHLKEDQEAVYAFPCADELRASASQYDGQAETMIYMSSESEALSFEVVDEQREYQNHSVDYMRDVEPEFDESAPDWIPVEAEMLVNEVDAPQKPFANLEVGEPARFTPPPGASEENGQAFPVLKRFPVEEPQEGLDSEAESQPEIESETPDEVAEENLVDGPVLLPVEETAGTAPEAVSSESQPEEPTPAAEVVAEPLEDDALANDAVSIEPIALVEETVETSSEEVEAAPTDSAIPLEAEAPDTAPASPEPVEQIDDPAELLSDDVVPEQTEAVFQDKVTPNPVPDESPVDESDSASEDAQITEREIEQEEEQLTRQIEINPRSATTWEALGTLYKTAGRYEEAAQAFRQAIAISPKAISYHHNLGLVYAAQGKNEEAFKTFQEVLELDPNHSLTHASLGGYYKKIGLDELAQKHIGKAMKHIYESENEYNRACMDAITGNVDRAINLLRIALENKQTYVDWVLNDPDLDSLRREERFQMLISEFSK